MQHCVASETLSPYSIGNWVCVGRPTPMKLTQQHEMHMANVTPNARGSNVTYISPADIGFALVPRDLAFGSKGFLDPTCWYQQHKVVALGVKPNTRP